MRVHYYVHGRGRGHASRACDVIRALSWRGIAVELFGAGDAADLLGRHPSWHHRSSLRPGVFSLPALACHTSRDVAMMRRSRPQIVISDGDQPALCAARLLGIPSLALGHDLALTCCELPAVNALWRWHQTINALPARVADRLVAVHFLPARVTRADVELARPDCAVSELGAATTPWPALPDDFVLCYFRDANGAGVVQLLLAAGARVVWFGPEARPGAGASAHPFAASPFRHALARCTAVVASAGSNLLAECVAQHKPLLALHAARDFEQALNAELAAHAQVAVRARIGRVSAAEVRGFLTRVRERTFATVELKTALPPVSEVVAKTVCELASAL